MEANTISQSGQTDQLRAGLRAMWGSVAPGWAEHAAYADARGIRMTSELLRLTAPRPGERVLELACGPGGVGIAAAPAVGPEGEVVISDVAPEMTAIAAARAEAAGLTNVRTRDLDLEDIDEPDASYDVVLCREGLMLVPDPARAATEIRRVLRPGGRAAITVWGPRERNPWLGVVLDAVSAQLGTPMPPAGVPGPFSLDDAEGFATVLHAGGLDDVAVAELPTPYHVASPEEWWTRTVALAGPLSNILPSLPAPARDALHARALEGIAPYATDAGLDIPGLALIASAARR
jgi:SAM-dependent methyltransferase